MNALALSHYGRGLAEGHNESDLIRRLLKKIIKTFRTALTNALSLERAVDETRYFIDLDSIARGGDVSDREGFIEQWSCCVLQTIKNEGSGRMIDSLPILEKERQREWRKLDGFVEDESWG